MEPSQPSSQHCPKHARNTPKSGNTTVYDAHFQDHLVDHGVFLSGSTYPDGTTPPKPANLAEIREKLQISRPSLALSSCSLEKDYDEFFTLDNKAADEQLVIKNILPVFEGKKNACFKTGGGHPFKNFAPLTDGTIANAKPDFYHGAPSNQLKPDIRKQLNVYIAPSTRSDRHIVPNFFFEAKGHTGSIPVAKRHAGYDGALGARAMHHLQQSGDDSSSDLSEYYDGNAYTITSTYHAGTFGMYATHPTRPRSDDSRERQTNCVTTQLGQWAMHGDPETFQRGVTAYRNARDLAQIQRDKSIKRANERSAP